MWHAIFISIGSSRETLKLTYMKKAYTLLAILTLVVLFTSCVRHIHRDEAYRDHHHQDDGFNQRP